MINFKSFILSLWFLVLIHPLVAQNSTDDKSKEKSKSKPNAPAQIKLTNPTRTQYSPILVAIGSTVDFKWEWVRETAKPIQGFNIILVRNAPTEIIYPIATNLSASDLSYSWDTAEYNNDPKNENQLIEGNDYKLYIYNSNYTYKYPSKFGELLAFSTDWSFFNSKTPSTKFMFPNSAFKSSSLSLLFVNVLVFLYLI
ncbi:hypothetical protein CONCODRAFT_78262, partial [Conidiobolus coronatus NRRL 28638]